jgi:hypothetical protein
MMCGMRRWTLAAAITGLMLLAPAAHAGTYDVVSCGAPGAGGANRAWTVDPASDNFETANCGSQMFAGTSAVAGRTAAFFTGANFVFTAPATTRIAGLTAWRYGQFYCCNGWKVAMYQGDANIVGGPFGETCTPPQGFTPCTFGAATGVTEAAKVHYALDTDKIFYSVACTVESGCHTSNDSGQRYAEMHLYGAAVTLRDDTPPALKVGGPLLAGGWHKPSDAQGLTFTATDATGIRSVAMAGAASNRACDFRKPVPCANATGTLTPKPALGDGVHQLTITALDAASNPTAVQRTVSIDGTPPNARIALAKGKRILVDVTDDVSGVRDGEIQVRSSTKEPFRALKTTLKQGRLRARLTRGSARRSDVKVIVTDHAGNRREGVATKIKLLRAGRRHVKGGRLTVANGRAVTIRGRVSRLRGASVGRARVLSTVAVARNGAPARPLPAVTTDAKGRFAIHLPKGPSRVLKLSTPGTGENLGATGRLSVRVPARSTMHASRTSLAGGGSVTFSGTVRRLGQPVPTRGLVIILQGREAGQWRTFEDTRTSRSGRWSVAYRFRGRAGTYPIRAKIRRQSRFPFVLGYSRTVRVHVR